MRLLGPPAAGPPPRGAVGVSVVSVSAARDLAPPGWDDEVRRAGGTTFHSAAFGRAAAAAGREAWYLRICRDHRGAGYAVGAGSRSRWPVLGPRRSVLAFETLPLLTPGGGVSLADAIAGLRSFARREGYGSVYFNSYADPQPEETIALAGDGLELGARLEFRAPLGPTLDATLARMAPGHRRNIRRGLASGFAFSEESTLAGSMTLRELQETTYGRRKAQGNAAAAAVPVPDYRVTMRSYLGAGAIRFWFVRRDGLPLSGIGVLLFGPWAYYLMGGTSREGYECRAAFALFGHVIDHLAQHGITELNLGGLEDGAEQPGHRDHGLYRFKAGFGARVLKCYNVWGAA